MQRIAIVINSLKKGGAEKQAVLLGRVLCGSYEVRIVVMRPEEGISEDLLRLYGGNKSDIIPLGDNHGRGMAGLRNVLREWKPQVMFCYLTYSNVIGAVVGRMCRVRYIYQGLRNAYIPGYKIPAELIANILSTGAVLNNHAGVAYFARRGVRHIKVIENCFPSVRDACVRQSHGHVTVVTVARFHPQKDYLTSIRAFRIAHDRVATMRYRIIGHGEDEALVRSWINAEGLDDCVEIFVNPPDVSRLVDECDIYMSTSLWEGTSNSIMEAMDASLPVVATDVGDNCRLVGNGVTGYLCQAGDVEAIASSLVALAESPSLRNDMGCRGNALLRECYDETSFREKYIALINDAFSASQAQEAQDR